MPKYEVELRQWGRYERMATVTVNAVNRHEAVRLAEDSVMDDAWYTDFDWEDGETSVREIPEIP